jgi:hypothetical protein
MLMVILGLPEGVRGAQAVGGRRWCPERPPDHHYLVDGRLHDVIRSDVVVGGNGQAGRLHGNSHID